MLVIITKTTWENTPTTCTPRDTSSGLRSVFTREELLMTRLLLKSLFKRLSMQIPLFSGLSSSGASSKLTSTFNFWSSSASLLIDKVLFSSHGTIDLACLEEVLVWLLTYWHWLPSSWFTNGMVIYSSKHLLKPKHAPATQFSELPFTTSRNTCIELKAVPQSSSFLETSSLSSVPS